MDYLGINWLGVILATLASFAFGAGWYMGLSRQWMAALGKTRDQLQVGYTPFIWSVADLLRGDYKQSEYGRVILPFTVLRRLDCVLEPTKVGSTWRV